MDIQKLLESLLPTNATDRFYGSSIDYYIAPLDNTERKALEDELLKRLSDSKDPRLIESLAYLKSSRALPILYDKLKILPGMALVIATSIFEINNDPKMIDVAIEAAKEIDNIKDNYHQFRLIATFYPLSKLNSPKANSFIEQFINDSEFLIAYNSKSVLGLDPL